MLARWGLQPFYVEPIGDDGFFFTTSLMGTAQERFFYVQETIPPETETRFSRLPRRGSFTDEREREKKTLDYNDWNIYHGA